MSARPPEHRQATPVPVPSAPARGAWLAAGLIALIALATAAPPAQAAAAGEAGSGGAAVVSEDARRARHIEQQLAWDQDLAPFALDVRVEDAVAHLSGRVATMAQSHHARRLVEAMAGVNAVVNAIYVDPALADAGGSGPSPPDDATLRERAALTLRRDASVETIELSTDARDGVVTLSGSVADIGSRQKAERAVRELHGVRRVVNELEVAPAVR